MYINLIIKINNNNILKILSNNTKTSQMHATRALFNFLLFIKNNYTNQSQ